MNANLLKALLISLLVVLQNTLPTNAAKIEKSPSDECAITFDGKVEARREGYLGDLNTLKALTEKLNLPPNDEYSRESGEFAICLNSSGDDWFEAREIASYLYERGIGTRIRAGHECLSACAIIFMAGRYSPDEFSSLNRFMHRSARLGFHAPYKNLSSSKKYSAQEVSTEIRRYLDVAADFVAFASILDLHSGKRVMDSNLVVQALLKDSVDFYFIDTPSKAVRFQVDVFGVPNQGKPSNAELANACINRFYWRQGVERSVKYPTSWKPNYNNGVIVEIYISDGTDTCSAYWDKSNSIIYCFDGDERGSCERRGSYEFGSVMDILTGSVKLNEIE